MNVTINIRTTCAWLAKEAVHREFYLRRNYTDDQVYNDFSKGDKRSYTKEVQEFYDRKYTWYIIQLSKFEVD